MNKKVTLVLVNVLFAACLLLLNGCQGKDSDKQDGKSLSFNETGLPILNEVSEFQMMGLLMNNSRQGRRDQTDMMLWLQDQTNVKIEWTLIASDSWQEKKNLVIASGDLPDAFHAQKSLSADEIQKFGSDGVLIPLDDLIDKYAPNIKSRMSPLYKSFTKSLDGNIYALSAIQDLGFDSLNASIIKTEWLDNLGLEMPTTTEEFYQVLKAFKTGDPNGNGIADEIPWSFLYKENPPTREVKREHYWIFPAFGIQDNPLHVTIQDNGELIFTANKEEWKDTIQYLSKLYSEGLIDPEVFSQDRATLTNKVRNRANVGAYTDYRHKFSIASPEVQDLFGIMPPLKGPKGDKGWMRAMLGFNEGSFAITSSCKSPETLIRWVDFMNEEENTVQMAFGMFKPADYGDSEALIPSVSVPGKYDVNTDLRPADVKPSEWPFSAPISVAVTFLTKEINAKFLAKKASTIAKIETCAVYEPYLSKYPYNYPYKFSTEEIEELSLIQSDLLNFIYTTEAKWIVRGFSDADWDKFKTQLDGLQIERYLELYKTAYNRQK